MFASASCLRSPAKAGLSTAKLVIQRLCFCLFQHKLPLACGERLTFLCFVKEK
jgi:hypothetical protein